VLEERASIVVGFWEAVLLLSIFTIMCVATVTKIATTPQVLLFVLNNFLPEVRLAIQSSMSVSPLNCSLKGEEPFVNLGV
jgi:hypothetical protein